MIRFFYRVKNSIKSRWYMNVTLPYIRKTLGACGSNVVIADHSRIAGAENIEIGDDVYIGPEALIYTTKAKLILGNHITTGPRLTIITGDHRTDVVGEYMKSVGDDRKLPENDQDVIIEDDVWIGVNVNIFKGVTIGKGSVIAGAATVVKDVPPYSIYISKDKILSRFTSEQIIEHEELIGMRFTVK